jgi:hypothetical protein
MKLRARTVSHELTSLSIRRYIVRTSAKTVDHRTHGIYCAVLGIDLLQADTCGLIQKDSPVGSDSRLLRCLGSRSIRRVDSIHFTLENGVCNSHAWNIK